MKPLYTFLFLFTITIALGQNTKSYLYKGTIDGKMPVTMYLESEDNGCTPQLVYKGMYKYDKLSNWLQLEITSNDKGQFIFTEYQFSGVLILQKTKEGFNGIWISPDTKRQLKVVLKKAALSTKDIQLYEDRYEKLNYSNYDC